MIGQILVLRRPLPYVVFHYVDATDRGQRFRLNSRDSSRICAAVYSKYQPRSSGRRVTRPPIGIQHGLRAVDASTTRADLIRPTAREKNSAQNHPAESYETGHLEVLAASSVIRSHGHNRTSASGVDTLVTNPHLTAK